jgi:predicted RNA binding protein YcfA (HicA-like mRNA interferase family)
VSKYSAVTGKELIAALHTAGFTTLRVKGSHHFLRHVDGRTTVVPVHAGESVGPGLLAKILRDVKRTRDDLEELLS